MIDGIATQVAGSIEELRDLLEPVDTLVDLTGEDPVVTITHGLPTASTAQSESATPPSG